MPEGDSTCRAASALRTALVGRTVSRFESPRLIGPSIRPGAAVERIDTHGKDLEVVFDDGVVLYTPMRLTGAWHLYRPGQKWRKRRHHASVIIETDEWVMRLVIASQGNAMIALQLRLQWIALWGADNSVRS